MPHDGIQGIKFRVPVLKVLIPVAKHCSFLQFKAAQFQLSLLKFGLFGQEKVDFPVDKVPVRMLFGKAHF